MNHAVTRSHGGQGRVNCASAVRGISSESVTGRKIRLAGCYHRDDDARREEDRDHPPVKDHPRPGDPTQAGSRLGIEGRVPCQRPNLAGARTCPRDASRRHKRATVCRRIAGKLGLPAEVTQIGRNFILSGLVSCPLWPTVLSLLIAGVYVFRRNIVFGYFICYDGTLVSVRSVFDSGDDSRFPCLSFFQ
jgi:hypothetical protein